MDVSTSNRVPGVWDVEHGSTQLLNAQCSLLFAGGRVSEAGCWFRVCKEMLCSPARCSLLQAQRRPVCRTACRMVHGCYFKRACRRGFGLYSL